MIWLAAILIVLAGLAGANLADLPALVRILVVLAAFGVGLAYERVRATEQSPIAGIGGRTAALAAALAAAAVVILLIPGDEPDRAETEDTTAAPVVEVGSLPEVRTRTGRLGRPVRAAGASFRVVDAGDEEWALDMQEAPAGSGRRWVALAVTATNRSPERLSPTTLSYRLSDAERRQYYPDRSSGTGPSSLGTTGSIGQGETAEVQLGFRVPASAAGLVLVFEPAEPGPVQVRVPLEGV